MDELEFELEDLPLSVVELTEDVVAAPLKSVDWREAALDYDYLRYTDPEQAYLKLADSIRGRYGDSPEVGIMVEAIKRIDAGTATVRNLIGLTEAWLRIVPENEYENRQSLIDGLASMYEYQQLRAADENVEFSVTFSAVGAR